MMNANTHIPIGIQVPITEERPWVVFSACKDAEPELFFPATYEDSREAVAICNSCPVRIDCLEYALEARERFGIWGGMTPKQRRRFMQKSA